jgi:hypothetical protein
VFDCLRDNGGLVGTCIDGGSLEGCLKLHWEIWCDCHLSGC